MDIEHYRNFCISLDKVEESTPFGDAVLVFKVDGKMFTLASIDFFEDIKVKCNPDIALDLRDRYGDVKPAFHMNKRHWNDISTKGTLPNEFIENQIINSYMLVKKKSK